MKKNYIFVLIFILFYIMSYAQKEPIFIKSALNYVHSLNNSETKIFLYSKLLDESAKISLDTEYDEIYREWHENIRTVENQDTKDWAFEQLIAILVRNKKINEAIKLSDMIEDPYSKAFSLCYIAEEINEQQKKAELFNKAINIINTITDIQNYYIETYPYVYIIEKMYENKLNEEADKLFNSTITKIDKNPDLFNRLQQKIYLCKTLRYCGFFDREKLILNEVNNYLSMLKENYQKLRILTELACEMFILKHNDEGIVFLNEIVELANEKDLWSYEILLLDRFYEEIDFKLDYSENIIKVTEKIKNKPAKTAFFGVITASTVIAGDQDNLNKLCAYISEIKNQKDIDNYMYQIVGAYVKKDNVEVPGKILSIVDSQKDKAYSALIDEYFNKNDYAGAEVYIRKLSKKNFIRPFFYARLISNQMENENFKKAFEYLNMLENPKDKVFAIISMEEFWQKSKRDLTKDEKDYFDKIINNFN